MENTQVVEEPKKKKTPKELTLYILKIVGNVVFYAFILIMLVFSIMNISSKGKDNFPTLFGSGYLTVASDSMTVNAKNSDGSIKNSSECDASHPYVYAENNYKIKTFTTNDLLFAKKITVTDANKQLKVGDVVTFYDDNLKALNTHRVIEISPDGSGIVTMGDQKAQSMKNTGLGSYSNLPDLVKESYRQNGYVEILLNNQIKGVVTGVSKGTGTLMKNWGWFLIPIIAIALLVEIIFVIKNIMDLKTQKSRDVIANDKEAMMAELAAEKERMRAELLAELAKEQAKASEAKTEEVKKEEEIPQEEVKEETTAEVVEEEKAEEPKEE